MMKYIFITVQLIKYLQIDISLCGEIAYVLEALSSVTNLGDLLDFLKPLATVYLPKYPTFLGIFSKGVKINHFSVEITFGQLL